MQWQLNWNRRNIRSEMMGNIKKTLVLLVEDATYVSLLVCDWYGCRKFLDWKPSSLTVIHIRKSIYNHIGWRNNVSEKSKRIINEVYDLCIVCFQQERRQWSSSLFPMRSTPLLDMASLSFTSYLLPHFSLP